MAAKKLDLSQFGFRSARAALPGESQECTQCETMLMDALDGTLSREDQAAFDLHLLGCPPCSGIMADAQRGAAWLEMLKSPRPEPPAELLERILSRTSGTQAIGASASTTSQGNLSAVPSNTLLGRPTLLPPVYIAETSGKILPFRSRFNLRGLGHTLLQPRLAMTAAMAFFSIALTLNLLGIRLSDLRAGSFRPSSIQRGIAEANAHVVRYYDNLRVVYELESRVHDLQTSGAEDNSSTPAPSPQSRQKQPGPPDNPRPAGSGSSQRETPRSSLKYTVAYRSGSTATPVPLDACLYGLQSASTTTRLREGRLA